MNAEVPDAFRAHFLQHNRRVLGIAALMFCGSFMLWAVLYFLCYWGAIFLLTLVQGVDATQPTGLLPKFILVAGSLCAVSLLRTLLWPYSHIGDRKSPLANARDVILALPNMTISSLQTLAAYRALDETELLTAHRLLQKIVLEGIVTIQQLPVEIPGEITRRKVMMALQLTNLIELHSSPDGQLSFRVGSEAGKRLGQLHVRISVKE